MDEKNLTMKEKLIIYGVRLFMLLFFAFVYVTPIFVLLFSIIYSYGELFSPHGFKCYFICFCVGFILKLDRMMSHQKLEK